jgi:mannose-6-phosphate isomerase-like protein (cupin superfamily)
MRRTQTGLAVVTALSVAALVSVASAGSGVAATAASSLKWTDTAIPAVKTAAVQGDMARGPSHFYLKYQAGFTAPRHHHTPDHYATTIAGQLVLVLDGKEQRLAPGSYFAFTDKAVHAARCEGSEDCVMFIDARGPWDVVPEK